MENFVVEALESRSSVHESKRHPEVLKKTEVGDDDSPQCPQDVLESGD